MKLSIVLCTKDREEDLRRCITSVCRAEKSLFFTSVEIIIIDDGSLRNEAVEEFKSLAESNGYAYKYHLKTGKPGLYYSRKIGTDLAVGDILLFLDDDVVINIDYLKILGETYSLYPKAGGICGVDINFVTTWYFRAFYRFFLLCSSDLGGFSISACCGSCIKWAGQTAIFETKFFLGFNMSFRKEKLEDIFKADWFAGYSASEDIFISYSVSRKASENGVENISYTVSNVKNNLSSSEGILLVNPSMKLIHNRSKLSRESINRVKHTLTLNHYYFIEYFKFPPIAKIIFFWNHLGQIILNIIRYPKYGPVKGYFTGLLAVLKLFFHK